MTTQLFVRSVLLATLALPALAQDPAPKITTTVAQGPVLVVKTARPDLAVPMAMSFGYEAELPDLTGDAHYVLSLGGDKKLKVETGKGDVGLVQVTADPGALMQVFAEQVESARPMLRGTMTMALQPQGIAAKDVAAMVDDIFAFPQQIQRLSLKVVGDPEAVATEGLDITLAMEPKTGMGFAAFVDLLQPCSQGAPMLPGGENAAMQMRGSIAPESLQKLAAPLLAFASRVGKGGAEEQKLATAMYDRFTKLYDGGFSASFGFPFQGHVLVGVLDGEATQKLVASEEYLTFTKNQTMGNRDLSIEVTPSAFAHRDLMVMRSRLTNDGPANPVMPDGTLDTYSAVIGTCMTIAMGGKEADAKKVFDAVLDQKVKRAPLADGNVVDMSMDLKAMFAMVQAQMGGAAAEPDEDMPAKVTITLGKRDKALSLHVHVK